MLVYEMARANLAEFTVDLNIEYGLAKPVTKGGGVTFVVIDDKTTAEEARQKMIEFLSKRELSPLSIVVVPGPEVKGKVNRRVTVVVRRDALVPDRKWTAG